MLSFKKLEIVLKNKGLNKFYLRNNGINPTQLNKMLKNGNDSGGKTINNLCRLLDCQPGDIMEYIPDIATDLPSDENARDDTEEYIFYEWIENIMNKLPIKERMRIEEEYNKQHAPLYMLLRQRNLQILLHSGYIERCKDGYRRAKKS